MLIRDGRVVDGTGNPWFRADIAVKDGSIAAVGRIEDKADEAPVDGVLSWRWRTFDEYLRELESFDLPTNFVPMVGHGTVRIDAMGFENRPPTEAELARMKATVREAMEAGAFGFSVGLAHAPGDYAQSDEVIEFAKVSASCGGMFGTHMRDYSDRIFESLEESFEVGRQARLPVVISHIRVQGEAVRVACGCLGCSVQGGRACPPSVAWLCCGFFRRAAKTA